MHAIHLIPRRVTEAFRKLKPKNAKNENQHKKLLIRSSSASHHQPTNGGKCRQTDVLNLFPPDSLQILR